MSLIIDEDESGEEAQEGEAGQHRHGVRRQGVQSRQDAVHFENSLFNEHRSSVLLCQKLNLLSHR